MLRLICFCLSYNVSLIAILNDLQCTVMPAKSDSDVMFCLQSYQILRVKICIEYSDVTNYNCNRRGLLIIKGNPANLDR